MIGLRQALFSGVSGMFGSQTSLATVGHNIANADTEGYSRQNVGMEARSPSRLGLRGFVGNGTQVSFIRRAHDSFIETQSLRDRGLRSFYAGRERPLDLLERLYNDGSSPTLGESFDEFFNQSRELSQDPSSFGARRSFVTAAENLALIFRNLAADANMVQVGIDDTLNVRVERINALAQTISAANATIVSTELNATVANDARDQRDAAVRELGGLIDLKILKDPDGSITVDIASGYNLVQGDVHAQLEATPNPANQGFLAIEFINIHGTRTDITDRIDEGEIGGLLNVRDEVIGESLDEINNLAFTFVTQANNIHAAGFGLDGVNGRALFTPIAGPGFAAAQVQLEAAIGDDPNLIATSSDAVGLPGNNENILAMSELQGQTFAALGGHTFNREYAELMSVIGTTVANNRQNSEFHQVRFDQTESLRESIEGVSMDEEMLDLTRFQKHFQANTKVIQTVSDMLDSVLRLVD